MIIMKLMGGLGLFIYGMKLMGDGLENAAGDGLKKILEKVTSNPIKAVLVGAIVTAVIQSSSATTVMVVGFVNAGLMNLTQATGIIMGANIGTTITAQLVSFKLDQIAPLFVFLGTIMVMFARGKKRKDIGNIVLGFGILFTGMGIMSGAMKPLTSSPVFEQLIVTIGDNWLIGVIAGATITAILQSSSATTGILVALATAGAINIQVALPIIFGCNIGTCITAIIASIGANKTAHKAAAIHLIFNIVGTIIFLPFLGLLGVAVTKMSPDVSRQIANAHTVFNIVNTMLLLPFSKYLIVIVNKIIPGEDEEEKAGPKYIDDRLLETPVIAAGQVIKETIRMAKISRDNFQLAMKAFFYGDYENIKGVYENENIINTLEREITEYLIALSQHNLTKENAELVSEVYHTINDIERIGDHAENIVELATSKFNNNIEMSKQALKEIEEIFEATLDSLDIAIKCFSNYDISNDKVVNEVEDRIDMLEKQFRNNNIARLNSKQCYASSGVMFFDLLSNLERIGDHANNIATVRENHSYKIYS